MAIEQCVVKSFKTEILKGLQDFTASTGNAFKLALFDSEATLNNTTTAYETTDEVGNRPFLNWTTQLLLLILRTCLLLPQRYQPRLR